MKRFLFSFLSCFVTLIALFSFVTKPAFASCSVFTFDPLNPTVDDAILIVAGNCTESIYSVQILNGPVLSLSSNGNTNFSTTINPGQLPAGDYSIQLIENGNPQQVISMRINPPEEDDRDSCNEAGETCCQGGQGARVCSDTSLRCNLNTNICESIDNPPQQGDETVWWQNPLGQGGCTEEQITTAIGCIPIGDVNALTRFFLGWALGIAGGISLFLIGFAALRIATSQGDPRRLQGGQELLMSAIGGLLMVVLSVYLLRFIGVDLLGLF